MSKSKTANDWLGALRESQKTACDEVPDGWETNREIAATIGKSPSRTSYLLREGIAAGRIESKKFRIESNGKVQPIPHYRTNDQDKRP